MLQDESSRSLPRSALIRRRLSLFLQSHALMYSFLWSESAKKSLLNEVFSALLGYDHTLWNTLLPERPTIDASFLLRRAQGHREGDEYRHGTCESKCGHIFRKGEVFYRCKTCSVDSNSALCVKCFRATSHKDHETSFTVSAGSGGCCDCGNAAAWIGDVSCKIHSHEEDATISNDMIDEIPEKLENSIQTTIDCVLDFVLDVFSCSPENLKKMPTLESILQDEKTSRLSENKYGDIDDSCNMYSLVLWNDEKHSFKQFYEQITTALELPNNVFGKKMANIINDIGRACIVTETNIKELLKIGQKLAQINLAVSIRSMRDIFREESCAVLLEWLADIAGSSICGKRNYFSSVICKELVRPWNCGLHNSELTFRLSLRSLALPEIVAIDSPDIFLNEDHINSSGPSDTSSHMLETDESSIHSRHWYPSNSLPDVLSYASRVRFDYFFLYDLKLWKSLRYKLQELYLGYFITQPGFKEIMGARIAISYRRLAELFLLLDREPEHSVIFFSMQIFTVADVAKLLVTEYDFLTTINATLYTFFTYKKLNTPNYVDQHAMIRTDSAAFHSRRYIHIFHHIQFMLSIPCVAEIVREDLKFLKQYADFFNLFQGMCPYTRAVSQHVEWENDSWMYVLNVSLQVAKLCRHVGNVFMELNTNKLANAINYLISLILYPKARNESWTNTESLTTGITVDERGNSKLIEYDIALQPVSFHHPLHWLLVYLLSFYVERDNYKLLWTQLDLLAVTDHPLRVCAWLSQMRAKLWIRNGTTLRDQAHHYRNLSFHEYTFDLDVLLLQLTLTYGDPDAILPSFISRFQLEDQMYGRFFVPHKHYDVSQVTIMMEEFLLLLISIVCNTAVLDHWDITKRIEYGIAHILCFRPLPYSEITKRTCEHLLEHKQFESTLKKVATFRNAEGINDSGSFTLKDEYFDYVDPFNIHYSRNQREEAENILRRRYSKQHSKHLESVVYEEYHPILHSNITIPILQSDSFVGILWHTIVYAYIYPYDQGKLEGLVNTALHACLLVLMSEKGSEPIFSKKICENRFPVVEGLQEYCNSPDVTLFSVLCQMKNHRNFVYVKEKISLIMKILKSEVPLLYEPVYAETLSISSSKIVQSLSDAEQQEQHLAKVRMAKERQARIMEQFRMQQNKFLENHALFEASDCEMDEADEFSVTSSVSTKLFLDPPIDTCLLCQEELKDKRPYGTLVFVLRSSVLRLFPADDANYVSEVLDIPDSLDHEIQERPFGLAGKRKKVLDSTEAYDYDNYYYEKKGNEFHQLKDSFNGFPPDQLDRGLHATGCGHFMHIDCFKNHIATVTLATRANPYRNHPHNLSMKEFLCPLCKALCNTIFPILWRPKEEINFQEAGVLTAPLKNWLVSKTFSFNKDLNQQLLDIETSPSEHTQSYNLNLLDVLQHTLRDSLKDIYTLNTGADNSSDNVEENADNLFQSSVLDHVHFKSVVNNEVPADERLAISDDIFELYRRLDDVIDLNSSLYSDDFIPVNGKLHNVVKLFSYSLCQVEASTRGHIKCSSIPADIWVHNLGKNQQVFLRILSESIKTYTLLCAHDSQKRIGGSIQEFEFISFCQQKRIFGRLLPSLDSPVTKSITDDRVEPLLVKDTFREFAEASVSGLLSCDESFHYLTQLYYTADIVRNLWILLSQRNSLLKCMESVKFEAFDYEQLKGFEHLVIQIWKSLRVDGAGLINFDCCTEDDLNNPHLLFTLYKLLERFSLIFLRKCALLWYCRYGVSFETQPNLNFQNSELSRLQTKMHIPGVIELCNHLCLTAPSTEWSLIKHWCNFFTETGPLCDFPRAYYPGIYELVSLPYELDKVFELLLARRCSKCLTEPMEPAICLFCGKLLCFQSHCCSFNGIGECNLHMQQCASDIGIFLIVKKCAILYLNPPVGSFSVAPFLDAYGETDLGLRRGRSQYLSQKRYDETVRTMWLNGSIPSYIARQLDANPDTGGWETL